MVKGSGGPLRSAGTFFFAQFEGENNEQDDENK